MGWLHTILDLFLHLDKHLNHAADSLGHKLYLLLFAIVFCETGLVVTPFLPGDSLLFALGALAASGSSVNLPLAIVLLCVAANCGDATNYLIGSTIGPKLFSKPDSRLFNRKHLDEAHRFYERHGTGTIILAICADPANLCPVCGRHRKDEFLPFRTVQRYRWDSVGGFPLTGRLFLWTNPHREK